MSVHLHARSCYSLLQSTNTISSLIQDAQRYGYKSLALTDFNVLHGSMAFHHACKKAGIHAIYGLEFIAVEDEKEFNLLFLAKNDEGFKSLMKLSTYLNTENKKIVLEDCMKYAKHCVVILCHDQCAFEQMIINEEKFLMEETLYRFNSLFYDFYVAVEMNDSQMMQLKNELLKECCQLQGIETVALSRIYISKPEDEESYRVLRCIDQGLTYQDKRLKVSSQRYFRSQEEMEMLYDEHDLANTDLIATKCQVEMAFEKAKLPVFENSFKLPSEDYLKKLCYEGLKKRYQYQSIPETALKRLKYELSVICTMKFADYFLIVYDFIRYARKQNIYVGPGRGSVPGSLVAYCLGITHVDPLKYSLVFERFLNPERISMPDIDTDFPDNRRDEVIDYVIEKYGRMRVAQIVTFNTLGAKQVLRDVGRCLGIANSDVDTLCKAVPNVLKINLAQAYQTSKVFQQLIHSSKQFERLYQIAVRLEGLPRHTSIHAAGVVLADRDIDEVCPLMLSDEGVLMTQYTMEWLEPLGLIKMDFLALRNLTIIDEIVQLLHQKANSIDIMKIPLDDAKTFECIRHVDTVGVFQLESEGMKNLIRQMQPNSFEDIAATIALFRPGPMENIPIYLKNRANPESIEIKPEVLKPILKDTYGIIIYQEQIMQIAQVMAGFTLAKADILRKAMSKKKLEDLVSLQQEFIDGALRKGYDQPTAQHVYDLILRFANYGFNRAHSIAYGLLAYQMAYLKANFPLEFFTCLLNGVIGSETKTSEYIFEARHRNIIILSPCINHSNRTFEIEDGKIRYPLLGIKNIGTSAADELIEEREKGEFIDFHDFVARMSMHRFNRKNIESLIYAGALDCFKITRTTLLASLDDALRYADIVKVEDANQLLIDFNLVSKPSLIPYAEDKAAKSQNEKAVLGFYLSNHPLTDLRLRLKLNLPLLNEAGKRFGPCQILGQIDKVKQHKTKRGDMMAFVVISDETSNIDLVIMPNIYQKISSQLVKGCFVLVQGKVDKLDSCLVNRIEFLKN